MKKGEYKRKEHSKDISLAITLEGETSPHLKLINAYLPCIPGPEEDTFTVETLPPRGIQE